MNITCNSRIIWSWIIIYKYCLNIRPSLKYVTVNRKDLAFIQAAKLEKSLWELRTAANSHRSTVNFSQINSTDNDVFH